MTLSRLPPSFSARDASALLGRLAERRAAGLCSLAQRSAAAEDRDRAADHRVAREHLRTLPGRAERFIAIGARRSGIADDGTSATGMMSIDRGELAPDSAGSHVTLRRRARATIVARHR